MAQCVRPYGAVLLLVIACGCAAKEPVKVTVEQGAAASGSHYRTYDWRSAAAEGNPLSPSAVTRREWRIRAIVDRLLAGKGYVRSPDAPDFVVDYDFAEKEKQTSSFEEYIAYYRAGGAKGPIDAFTSGYSEGSLVLGIFDVPTQHLIWRASATAFADQTDSDARLEEALQQMLARWPSR
jgi:hypothetical protein